MKTYKYIESVKSHISGKRRKAEVEAELFDHLDENEKFFCEIGYDETLSEEKAQGNMGDADIVGEQLDAVGRKLINSKAVQYAFSVFSVILMLSAYIILALNDISGSFSYTEAKYIYNVSPFWSFAAFSLIFIIGLINFLIGLKRKNIFSLSSGFAICETIVIIGPYNYYFLLDNLFNKADYVETFFMQQFIYLTPHNLHFASQYCVVALFACVILIAFIIALNIIIKTKLLKNTKRDLTVKKALLTFTGIVAICISVISASVIGLTVYNRESIYNKTFNDFSNIEKEIISRVDELGNRNYYKIQSIINAAVKNSDVNLEHQIIDETEEEWANRFINIDLYYDPDNEETREISFTVRCEIMNPFDFRQKSYNVYDKAKGNLKNIKTVLLPAMLEYYSSESGCNIAFEYDSEYYYQKNIIYDYNYENNKFELTSDSFTDFEEEATLTEYQKYLLGEALKNFYVDEKFSSTETEFGNTGKYIWLETYGVYKSNRFGPLYKIDLSFTAYDIQITSGVYDKINFSNGYPYLGASIIVQFSEDTADIIDYYYPNHTEYSTTEELISILNGIYNEGSFSRLKESNPAKHSFESEDYPNLKNKIREEYLNRFN